jgi:hypothetical protein
MHCLGMYREHYPNIVTDHRIGCCSRSIESFDWRSTNLHVYRGLCVRMHFATLARHRHVDRRNDKLEYRLNN